MAHVSLLGILHDTIHVEHNIVIPSIRDLYKLPFEIPDIAKEDLFKLVKDEGHHAAQSLTFIHTIRDKFDIQRHESGKKMPLFITILENSRDKFKNDSDKALFTMIIGVVTETRISKKLGLFTPDNNIISSVVNNFRSHQEDETIHASQFRALGIWRWSQLSEHQKDIAASIYAETTIMRSLPDIGRMLFYFKLSTGCSVNEVNNIIRTIFTDEKKEEMLIAAGPTISFLKKIGITEYPSAKRYFKEYGISV